MWSNTPPDVGATTAYLGLGTNLGDREAYLMEALERLRAVPGIEVVRVSGIYETEPWGRSDQPAFLNLVAEVATTASPRQVLDACLQIERELGRKRTDRWAPRVIDIDLLLFGDRRIDEPDLRVPHPLLEHRQFVLVPLAEIAPDVVLPSGRTAAEAARSDDPVVKRFVGNR
ncbi:MAG: 2-amino-4-hydroxy-6-hydroxymethyldihydropteridine diphosphokinase [Armatimonadota bacterium]